MSNLFKMETPKPYLSPQELNLSASEVVIRKEEGKIIIEPYEKNRY